MQSEFEIWRDELTGKRPPFPWLRFIVTGAVVIVGAAYLICHVRVPG